MRPNADAAPSPASRVGSQPWVGVRSSCWPKASVHGHGVPTGAAAFMMWPYDDVGEQVEIVVTPFAGWAAR